MRLGTFMMPMHPPTRNPSFREQVGDFGTLYYPCHDWVDPALGKRSMQLMAEEVMPRVNAAIGARAHA